jgi:hypothetical protein
MPLILLHGSAPGIRPYPSGRIHGTGDEELIVPYHSHAALDEEQAMAPTLFRYDPAQVRIQPV